MNGTGPFDPLVSQQIYIRMNNELISFFIGKGKNAPHLRALKRKGNVKYLNSGPQLGIGRRVNGFS